MKASIVVFPGTNRERDLSAALARAGATPVMVWHKDTTLPSVDAIVLPGGFSYGDYLRSGAIAAHSPVMREVVKRAGDGVTVLGICNGFQILTETGLLPGALMRNASLRFICRDVHLRIDNADTRFTRAYEPGQVIRVPVAHGDGNYFADDATLLRLEGEGRVAFRYVSPIGVVDEASNPNGSQRAIAGILNEAGNVLGLMPHPEDMTAPVHGGSDGLGLFESLVKHARAGVPA